jgi:hypothetical protein
LQGRKSRTLAVVANLALSDGEIRLSQLVIAHEGSVMTRKFRQLKSKDEGVIHRGLDLAQEELRNEDWMTNQRESVAALIARGFAQAERGDLTDGVIAVEALRQRRKSEGKCGLMNEPFPLTTQGVDDLDSIWCSSEEHGGYVADLVVADVVSPRGLLAKYPVIGHLRSDVTTLPVSFRTLPKHPNFTIVFRPRTKPLQVVGILRRS